MSLYIWKYCRPVAGNLAFQILPQTIERIISFKVHFSNIENPIVSLIYFVSRRNSIEGVLFIVHLMETDTFIYFNFNSRFKQIVWAIYISDITRGVDNFQNWLNMKYEIIVSKRGFTLTASFRTMLWHTYLI